jgi:hypothetical protein
MRSIVPILTGLVLAAVVVGCGPKRPHSSVITGKVTYKGQPLAHATLLVYPPGLQENLAPLAYGIQEDGSYKISDLPAGEYKMVIQGAQETGEADLSKIPPEKRAEVKEKLDKMRTPATIPFPKKYQSPSTTPLKCTITDKDQQQDLTLEG